MVKSSHDFLQYLSDKLDILDARLDHMNETLIVQQEQLREHMRRSALNEEAIELLKNELKPLQEDWLRVRFLGKVLAVLAGSASVFYYAIKIVKGE